MFTITLNVTIDYTHIHTYKVFFIFNISVGKFIFKLFNKSIFLKNNDYVKPNLDTSHNLLKDMDLKQLENKLHNFCKSTCFSSMYNIIVIKISVYKNKF